MVDPQTSYHQNVSTCAVWRKPMEEFFKCNVDAGFGSDKRSFGVGMVIRDSNGSFILSRTNFHHGSTLVKEAEALAVHEALSWIKELGYGNVIVETDSKTSVDAIHSDETNFTEFGLIISALLKFPLYLGFDGLALPVLHAFLPPVSTFIFPFNPPFRTQDFLWLNNFTEIQDLCMIRSTWSEQDMVSLLVHPLSATGNIILQDKMIGSVAIPSSNSESCGPCFSFCDFFRINLPSSLDS